MWALGFEPRFSRPQREVLTTIRCPHTYLVSNQNILKMAFFLPKSLKIDKIYLKQGNGKSKQKNEKLVNHILKMKNRKNKQISIVFYIREFNL